MYVCLLPQHLAIYVLAEWCNVAENDALSCSDKRIVDLLLKILPYKFQVCECTCVFGILVIL